MADTQRLPEPLVANWEWQTTAACRGLDSCPVLPPLQ